MRGEPRIVVHAANRDIDKAGTRRVLAIQTTAARRAEMPGIDVSAFGSRGIAGRRSRDRYVIALEAGQRHMAGAGRALAVFAVALPHADRFRMDRETHSAAKATPRRKWLFRHARPRASTTVLVRREESSSTGRNHCHADAREQVSRLAADPKTHSGSLRADTPGCQRKSLDQRIHPARMGAPQD